MSTATLERRPKANQLVAHEEEYAHSLDALRRVGAVALKPNVTASEVRKSERSAKLDFTTAVAEMVKTDLEFRNKLDIDNVHEFAVINDQACDENGTPIVDITDKSLKKSEELTKSKPQFKAQAIRDWYDKDNAQKVDELTEGMARIMVAMDPKEELKDKKTEETYKKLGYKEELVYIQFYAKGKKTVTAGSYSVDMSNEQVWRDIFADRGVIILEGESPNTWIRNAIEIKATAEEAEAFVLTMRTDYYRRVGSTGQKLSVTEYTKANQHITDQFFDAYYPDLSKAIVSGRNNKTLQTLARELLNANISKLMPEVRQQLERIGNSESFDDDSAMLLDSLVRYAVVEQLRKGLRHATSYLTPAFREHQPAVPLEAMVLPPVNPSQLNQVFANNVETGTRAGRSYGGCPGQIKLNTDDSDTLNNPQDVYGGKTSEKDGEDKESQECEYSGTFCYCCPYNSDGTPLSKPMEVTIKRDKDGVATCQRPGCEATMDARGKATKGKIYERAMQLARQKSIKNDKD